MIEIKDPKQCCGCTACKSICPKNSITMIEDIEGFLYPQVNINTCVNCGACNNVCPIENPVKLKPFKQKAVLFQHKDQKILKESTSGGLFTALATWVINHNGFVFGAAYDGNFAICHQVASTIEELSKFRNSKYAQSVIGDCFQKVRELLKQDNWVLFSGTPCQLEGLHKFLRKDYEKLVMVDIVCHACPSPLVFRKYIELIKKKYHNHIKNIRFRDKIYGYKYSQMTFYNDMGKVWYNEGIDTDIMLRAFFNNISPRPSCFACPSKKKYRVTDFTIWDCFDVDKFSKVLDNDKGVTRSLLHTPKAWAIWEDVKSEGISLDIPVDKAVEGVKEMYYSIQMNPLRQSFFDDLITKSPEDVFKKYFPVTFRHIMERQARLWSNRLGIYKLMKKVFKLILGNKDIKR